MVGNIGGILDYLKVLFLDYYVFYFEGKLWNYMVIFNKYSIKKVILNSKNK